jgi:hypothetical protein
MLLLEGYISNFTHAFNSLIFTLNHIKCHSLTLALKKIIESIFF